MGKRGGGDSGAVDWASWRQKAEATLAADAELTTNDNLWGRAVELHGLGARPDLNGLKCVCASPLDVDTGRYVVKLVKQEGGALKFGERLNVQPKNLKLVEDVAGHDVLCRHGCADGADPKKPDEHIAALLRDAQLAGTRGVAHSYVAFARKHPDKIAPATVVTLNAIAVESAILRDWDTCMAALLLAVLVESAVNCGGGVDGSETFVREQRNPKLKRDDRKITTVMSRLSAILGGHDDKEPYELRLVRCAAAASPCGCLKRAFIDMAVPRLPSYAGSFAVAPEKPVLPEPSSLHVELRAIRAPKPEKAMLVFDPATRCVWRWEFLSDSRVLHELSNFQKWLDAQMKLVRYGGVGGAEHAGLPKVLTTVCPVLADELRAVVPSDVQVNVLTDGGAAPINGGASLMAITAGMWTNWQFRLQGEAMIDSIEDAISKITIRTSKKSGKAKLDENTLQAEKLPELLLACAKCKMFPDKVYTCGNCGAVHYCSKNCQKDHWKDHKQQCAPCKIPAAEGA